MTDKSNPTRPIEPPTVWKPVEDCEHPWHRLAMVALSSLTTSQREALKEREPDKSLHSKAQDPSIFQCGECGVFLRANDYLFMFEVV